MRALFCTLLIVASATHLSAQCAPVVQHLVTDRRYDDAKAEVRALLKHNEKDDSALHCMGTILIESGDSKGSVEWFEKAIDANDKSSAHHLWLANALGEQAEHTSKIKLPFLARRIKSEFDRAAQLDPSSIDARHGLIEFYSQAPGVMGGSMDRAKDQAREILKLSAWRGHYEMGRLLERDKDVAGAEKDYIAAVTAAPDSTPAYQYLGAFYRRQKRYDDALKTYETALQHRPDANGFHLTIANTLFVSGQNLDRGEREAREWLASAPADAPKVNLATAHYLLGQFAEKSGKKDVAKAEYQQALTIVPSYSDAKKALDALQR
ncbi:MAG TPA: tetratricopeptide repeat protein [Gemmatimonadaceae bacterium]|jgi:tetratricopeptide (TPR) repeat protein